MQKFFSDAAAFVAREKKRRLWIAAVLVLACAVVIATACALIRPAAALEAPVTYCGKEEHTHTDACYTRELTCGQEELAGHTHTDACYETQKVLVCGQEESAEHTHTDACYETQQVLVCGQEESEGHTHTDACYSEVLTCGKEEHTHTEACYVDPNGDGTETGEPEENAADTDVDAAESGVDEAESADSDADSSDEEQDGVEIQTSENALMPAPLRSNSIMTMALDPQPDETYAIVDSTGYAMTSGLNGQQVVVGEDGKITVGLNTDIAIWTFDEQTNGKYYISTGNRYLRVTTTGYGGATLTDTSSSYNAAAFTVTEQQDGTYQISCQLYGTTYYLYYSNQSFNVTRYRNSASNFYIAASSDIERSDGKIDGLTPTGTVINLFDYSVLQDVSKEMNQPVYPNHGINYNHALKFTTGSGTDAGTVNAWTKGNGGVLQGIVANTLQDGYPVLSGTDKIFSQIHDGANTEGLKRNESLQYLFDPNESVNIGGTNYKASYPNVGGLLQIDDEGYYYYDSTKNYAEFNKTNKQFTLYDDWAVQYTPNKPDGKPGDTEYGQFFPFAAYKDVDHETTPGDGTHLNYYFGMTLTTRFVQDYGGHTDSTRQKDTTFEFSGDDDVWIFIDDVLVADLGGIHLAADVDINFADGTVYINKVYENGTVNSKTIDLAKAFRNAGKTVDEANGWVQNDDDNWIFADDTYHTLKFFYLERGGYASNMMVKYNLKSIPASSIVKVDQYGEEVPNAEFALYAAQKDENGVYQYKVDGKDEYVSLQEGQYTIQNGVITTGVEKITPIYQGSTDSEGNMTFVDSDGMPLALSDLQEMGGTTNFILRETKVPDGYRGVNDEVWMYLEGGILYSDNTYDSGAWAAANALVTATDNIYLNDQNALENGNVADEISKVVSNATVTNDRQVKLPYYSLATEKTEVYGTLFAVVLKYNGDTNASSMTNLANWAPVYGNDLQGYQVKKTNGDRTSFVTAVIDTAKIMEANADYGDSIFDLGSSGSMQVLITQLPGDMKTYYSVLLKKYKDETNPENLIAAELGYTVAYYWTTASSLNEATPENTFRVNAEASSANSYDGFERTFGASIEVPNLINRVFVQKIVADENGNKAAIAGARFALYSVVQDTEDGKVYYIAQNDFRIHLDKAIQNKGTATVKGSDTSGTYTVDPESGDITVTVNGQTYTIMPQRVEKTEEYNTEAMAAGTAVFTNTGEFRFTQGTYYIREIDAPKGYEINNTEIQVLVDDNTIYTNAGTESDGVSVGRGPGYVVKPLLKSAAYDDIDNTLTWVYAQMKVTRASTNFSDAYTAATEGQYVTGYTGQGYGAVTTTGTTPQTTNLVYSGNENNTVFNYTVREPNSEASDTDPRLLFTSVGWSDYQIYQDTTYGQESAAEGAEYTVLTNEDQSAKNIANLFSRSTYIQVEDARVSKLKISKTVAVDPSSGVQNAPSGQLFTFTVNLYTADSTTEKPVALTVTYPYTVYDATGSPIEDVSTVNNHLASGTIGNGGTVTLHAGEYVVIEELPYDAKYKVIETSVPGYTASCTADGAAGSGSSTGDLKQLKWETSNYTSVVDFTNTYKEVKPANLTLIKVDSANQTPLSGAKFVLYKEVESGVNQYYYQGNWTPIEEGKQESDYEWETDGKGEIRYVGLTEGTYYLKELEAPAGYSLLTNVVSFSVTADGGIPGSGSYIVNGSNPEFTMKVGNSSGVALPETGGTGTIYLTIGGLLLMAVAAGGYELRRRHRKEVS